MSAETLELPPPAVAEEPVKPVEQAPPQESPKAEPVSEQQVSETAAPQAADSKEEVQQDQSNQPDETSPAEQAEQKENSSTVRVKMLQGVIDDLANNDGTISDETRGYLQSGGSINSALSEIETLRSNDPTSVEGAMVQARQGFSESLSRHRRHKKEIATAKEQYATALVQFIQSKAPTELKPDTESSPETADPNDLISRELAVVSDAVLAERVKLKEAIEDAKSHHLISRLMRNKKVRLGVIGAVVGTALTAHFGVLPGGVESEYLEHGLSAMSTFVFTRDSQKEGYRHITERLQSRKTKKRQSDIAGDPTKAKIVGSTVKRSLEHPAQHEVIHDRSDISSYVGNVLTSHSVEIRQVTEDADKRVEVFSSLVQKLVVEEVAELHSKVITNGRRAKVFEALALAVSVSPASPIAEGIEDAAQTGEDSEDAMDVDLD